MSDFSVDTLTVETTLNAPTSATTTAEISSAVSAHSSLTNNPHATTKAQVGLGNCDNTSDLNKPISTATQTALNLKYDASNPNSYETTTQLNARDVANRNRANGTGTQLSNTISDFATAADARITAQKGVANGLVPLDGTTKIASIYLPSFVDDVLEFANLAAFPVTGETGKMYVDLATNKVYRWSGTVYVEISGSAGTTDALVEGSVNLYFTPARVLATVIAGLNTGLTGLITASDTVLQAFGRLQNSITTNLTTLTGHIANTSNPHATTKAQVGLGSVDNTADNAKPVSAAQQTALNLKSNLSGGNTFTGNQNFGAAPVNIPLAPLNLVNSAGGTLLTQLSLINTGGGGGAGSAIDFHTYDVSGGTTAGARIVAIDDNFSAYLAFYTKIAGAATNATIERMRIANNGDVTIGTPLGSPLTNNPLSVNGTVDGFLQSNVQNTSTGANASADVIATADNGTDSNFFIDMGVNNSTYADPTFTINGPNDGYLYVQGGDLSVGTGAANKIVFFTEGTLAANEKARITPTGQFALGVTAPSAASKFQIDSTTQGFLQPRMTSAQRLAIATPPTGLSVYDTSLNTVCTYTGAFWSFETNYNTTAIQTSTSNTYANVTEWVTASIDVGLYAFRLRGIAQSTSTTTGGFGLRLQNATATVTTVGLNWTFNQAAAGTDKDFEYQQTALNDNVTSASVITANANFAVHGDGVFRVTVAGTVAIQIRSETNGVAVSIRPDSTFIIKKVGV